MLRVRTVFDNVLDIIGAKGGLLHGSRAIEIFVLVHGKGPQRWTLSADGVDAWSISAHIEGKFFQTGV